MKNPVQLSCEHWCCKLCLSSDPDESVSPADCPCPQCGKKSKKTLKQEKDTETHIGKLTSFMSLLSLLLQKNVLTEFCIITAGNHLLVFNYLVKERLHDNE